MKTAEEWLEPIKDMTFETRAEQDAHTRRYLKQIQLDAMKEGMRRAADNASKIGLQYGDYDPSRDGRIVGNAIRDTIFTAAEQLTEKDL